jgi:flagellar biogenesis protein FliO
MGGTVGTLTAVGVKIGLGAALAVGAVLATRYLQQARIGWRLPARSLRVLETAVLGQQRALHLIAVGGRTLLIASTQGQVALLADVTGEPSEKPADATPDTLRRYFSADAPPHSRAHSFAAVISRLLPSPEPPSGPAARLHLAAEKLRATSSEGAE